MNLDIISHVFYAFVRLREDGSVYHLDEKADTQLSVDGANGCLEALTKLRRDHHPNLKLLLSVGGGSGSKPFPGIAADPTKRQTFATSIRAFVDRFHFDGVDIDWEHPTTPSDGANYTHLLDTLRTTLPSPRYLLTAALSAGEWCLRNLALAALAAHLDFVNLMCYDFAGPWTDGQAGHHAQLYAPHAPHNAFARRSCHGAVEFAVARGVPPAKIVLGVPVYGRSFLGVDAVGQRFGGHAGEGGIFEFRELPRPGAEERVDEGVVGAVCVGGDGGLVSYDNARTVARKAEYVRERGLGGMFYWTGIADKSGRESLLLSGYEALHGKK